MREVQVSDDAWAAAQTIAASVKGFGIDEVAVQNVRQGVAADPVLAPLSAHVTAELRHQGAVLIRCPSPPDDACALALFHLAATASSFGNGGVVVHPVSVRPDVDADLSDTAAEFALHTDSTFLRGPHQVIALACVRNHPSEGGDSRLLHVDRLRELLLAEHGAWVLQALAEPAFPFYLRDPLYGNGLQFAPVLSDDGGPARVRYRADVLDGLRHRMPEDEGSRHAEALARLEATLSKPDAADEFSLRPGEMLVLDNTRVLHGRTPIAPGASRLLWRLKGYNPTDDHGWRMT